MVNASAVIVGHNHPSGDPEPGGDDFEMTERLVRAGQLLGLAVIDHIIIGHNSFVSLKNHCYCPKPHATSESSPLQRGHQVQPTVMRSFDERILHEQGIALA